MKILKFIRDYIVIFFFKNVNFSIFILHFNIIEKVPIERVKIIKKKSVTKKNGNKEIVNNILKKILFINSNKYMYYGLLSVYISIFFRLIKENKNHAIFIYKSKVKNYIIFLKKTINNFFMFLFFIVNYNLINYRINLIKKIYYIFFFIKLILLKKRY
jgi:hypothetical protein